MIFSQNLFRRPTPT
ncbi:hypothetical protein B1T42_11495, partial [Staphylococcus aureus]